MNTLKYAWITLKHKWFVLVAGLRIGGISLWRLLIHDWTKFLPSELPHYGRQFFGDGKDPVGWGFAWLRHQNRNPHHWEYWIGRDKKAAGNTVFPMPEWAVREMIADWMAAGKAYEGAWPDPKSWTWVNANLSKLDIHPDTFTLVTVVIIGMWPEEERAHMGLS